MPNLRSAFIGLAAVAVTAASVVVSVTTAEAVTNPIQIAYVYWNSPGADTGSNTSLNAEYVRIKNTGTRAKVLTGWTLRDAQNHVYKFGTFTLGAGKTVVIHTGRGTNTSTNRYWGSRYYIWNNTGDKAILRTNTGVLADTALWKTGGRGYSAF